MLRGTMGLSKADLSDADMLAMIKSLDAEICGGTGKLDLRAMGDFAEVGAAAWWCVRRCGRERQVDANGAARTWFDCRVLQGSRFVVERGVCMWQSTPLWLRRQHLPSASVSVCSMPTFRKISLSCAIFASQGAR